MSSDDHGHDAGHGHDSGAPTDIIPAGSWQDWMLAAVCVLALIFLSTIGYGYAQPNGIYVPVHETHKAHEASHNPGIHEEHSAAPAEHASSQAE